jgi:DNA-binding transcriptional ArsR family regulator
MLTSFYRPVSSKVERMHQPKFKSLGFALAFYISHNPARAKYKNLLEPEGGTKPYSQDFSGDSPLDLWAEICRSIHKILKAETFQARKIFWLRNAGDRSGHLSIEDIAKEMGMPPRFVARHLRDINDTIEDDLIRKGIVEPREDEAA